MNITETYLEHCSIIIQKIKAQQQQIQQTAQWFAKSILAGRVVHLFGTGHSRIMVEEMWPRYGSFPALILLLSYHLPITIMLPGLTVNDKRCFLKMLAGLQKEFYAILI